MAVRGRAEQQSRLEKALRAMGWRASQADREEWIRRQIIARIERWLADGGFSIESIGSADVLRVAADRMRVQIREVESNEELERVVADYAQRRERSVAVLATEFDDKVEAGIVRLENAEPWERPFLALVDARGERAASRFFSACHEVAHAILEPQLEFGFRCRQGSNDPLERIVDLIAGEIAFFEPLMKPLLLAATGGALTIDRLLDFRSTAAPAASLASTCAAAVRLWACPALWLVAQPRAAKDGRDRSAPPLRVVSVGQNALARSSKLLVPPNFRVPVTSVIHEAFRSAWSVSMEATEDMSQWRTSAGEVLKSRTVRVSARRYGSNTVYALIAAEGPRLVRLLDP